MQNIFTGRSRTGLEGGRHGQVCASGHRNRSDQLDPRRRRRPETARCTCAPTGRAGTGRAHPRVCRGSLPEGQGPLRPPHARSVSARRWSGSLLRWSKAARTACNRSWVFQHYAGSYATGNRTVLLHAPLRALCVESMHRSFRSGLVQKPSRPPRSRSYSWSQKCPRESAFLGGGVSGPVPGGRPRARESAQRPCT
jgi:hypothetical protein